MSDRITRWLVVAAIAVLIPGVIFSRAIESGVRQQNPVDRFDEPHSLLAGATAGQVCGSTQTGE